MFDLEFSRLRIGIDLLSLPLEEWKLAETPLGVRRLISAFLEQGAEITLVAPRFMEERLEIETIPQVKAYFLPVPAFLPPRIYLQQTLMTVLFGVAKVNRVLSLGYTVPAFYPGVRALSASPRQAREWWKLVPALLLSDFVAVECPAQKGALESRFGHMKASIEVVSPAIGEEFHPYPREASRDLLERNGIRSKFLVYWSMPESSRVSQALVALEAFAKIARRPRIKSMQLVLAGLDDHGSRPLRRRVRELELEHRVVWVDGIAHSEWPLWLSAAQLAIVTGSGDESIEAVLRAMACACPVILPNSKTWDTRLEGAVMHCREMDPKALAEAVTRLLAEAELRDELVHEGQQIVADYSWKRRGSEFLRAFESARKAMTAIPATVLNPA